MEILNYYIKTLSAAGGKLLPVGVFLLVGYFLFIKLPFYFMVKVNKDNKPKVDANPEAITPPEEKLKLEQNSYQEKLARAREEKERQQKQKKKEEPPKKAQPKTSNAEEIFEIPAGQILNQKELKKRYFELLKQNHPDKVASLGNDFKVLAEKKTKAINSAYEELKKKAS
jgi:hypothetical protein